MAFRVCPIQLFYPSRSPSFLYLDELYKETFKSRIEITLRHKVSKSVYEICLFN